MFLRREAGALLMKMKQDTTQHVSHRAIGVTSSLMFYVGCGVQCLGGEENEESCFCDVCVRIVSIL